MGVAQSQLLRLRANRCAELRRESEAAAGGEEEVASPPACTGWGCFAEQNPNAHAETPSPIWADLVGSVKAFEIRRQSNKADVAKSSGTPDARYPLRFQ
jgi:hypothetical protein